MQRRTKVLGAAALVLCLTVGWPVAAHYYLKAKLHAYQRQLQAQGEKLTTKELTPPLSAEGVRAADALIAVGNRLPWLDNQSVTRPPTMTCVAPGQAIVGWQQEPLVTWSLTNVWPLWSALIVSNEPHLAQARAALQSPRLMVPLDYSQGFRLRLPHLELFENISMWLSADTVVALHQHRPEEAWESLESLVALAQRHTAEPTKSSVWRRGSIINIATETTWEVLQSPELHEPQLQELQALWTAVDLLPQAEAALSMERIRIGQSFADCRVSYANFNSNGKSSGAGGLSALAEIGKELLKDPKEGVGILVCDYPRYWKWKGWSSYEEELAEAQSLQAGLEALRTARQPGAFGSALRSLGADKTRDFISRVSTCEIQRALVVTALALKRYQLAHGAYPPHLGALVPAFLPHLPRDPADGHTLRYRLRVDGSFLLYSAGLDGEDNGGDPNSPPLIRLVAGTRYRLAFGGFNRGYPSIFRTSPMEAGVPARFQSLPDIPQAPRPRAGSHPDAPVERNHNERNEPLAQIGHAPHESATGCRGRRQESLRGRGLQNRTPDVVPYKREISGLEKLPVPWRAFDSLRLISHGPGRLAVIKFPEPCPFLKK